VRVRKLCTFFLPRLDKRSELGLLCFFRCLLCGLLLGPLLLLLAGTLLGLLGCSLKYAPISIVTTTISHRQTDRQTDRQTQTQTHTHENTKGRGKAAATRQEKCFAIAQTPCKAQTSQRRALPPRKRGSRAATFRRTAFCSAALRCPAFGCTALSLHSSLACSALGCSAFGSSYRGRLVSGRGQLVRHRGLWRHYMCTSRAALPNPPQLAAPNDLVAAL
jgi:hypothetical protein